jgi:signal transduction histidine kinase
MVPILGWTFNAGYRHAMTASEVIFDQHIFPTTGFRDNGKRTDKTAHFQAYCVAHPLHAAMTVISEAPIRILFVEDSEFDHELMLATLARDGLDVDAMRIEEAGPMREALQGQSWDAVVSDHNLPHFSSFEALQVLRDSGLDLPFLVVSGELGEELAVETMLAGADDYIMKSRLKRLAPALRRSLEAARVRRERSAVEAALRASESRLRELAGHLENVKEQERAAFAREIHDDIGGALTALKFDLAWLQRHASLPPVQAARLATAIEATNLTAMATQRVVRDLRPGVIDQGIVPALEWLTTQFAERTGIETHFDANRDDSLDPLTSITLYRICQEALTNVTKHALASRVDVQLFIAADQVHLEISDNGKGLANADRIKPTSFGLTGMLERARNLNGSIEFSGASGKGTTVMLSLPWSRENTIRSES